MSVTKTIYTQSGGLGLILTDENRNDHFEQVEVSLHGTILKPNSFTDLDGLFTKPLLYVGLLKNEKHKTMCFLTGDQIDLFVTEFYYCFIYISDTIIVNQYSYNTAKKYMWKNNQWT